MSIFLILTVAIVISAMVSIRAEYHDPRYMVYLFKPLTTGLIILMALLLPAKTAGNYKMLIVAGLCFSLVGDVFLMLPSDKFIPGLASFLIAHLFYIAAFTSGVEGISSAWLLIFFLAYAIIFLRMLTPHLGKMKLPVLIYAIIIAMMGWLAWERWLQTGEQNALLAAIGAVFFIVSDSVLAYNRFVGKFSSARLIILSTYFLAQWLIALSV
jgi:uncharacterized membrane protein YhhN